jgi:hypothetical protein
VTDIRVVATDDGGGFARDVDDPELLGVEVYPCGAASWTWEITVWVAQYLREDPLENELRRDVEAALTAVPDVAEVAHEDREVWLVRGGADGGELVRAVAAVVDALAPRAEEYLEQLAEEEP